MPKEYEHTVEWATNHWSIYVDEIEYDGNGQRIKTIGNDPRLIYLYPDGRLLAILNGGRSTREELIRWEDNLRQLLKNENKKESQQGGPEYSAQGALSPDP